MPIASVSQFGVDPIEGSEIMHLLDFGGDDLKDMKKFNKLQDVISYLKGRKDKRSLILKVIQGKRSEDSLDAVWTWVQLQAEKERHISSLDPQDFTEDIHEQLKQKILTKDNLTLLKQQTTEQVKQSESRISELRTKEASDIQAKRDAESATKQAMKFKKIEKTLSQIELTNQALAHYE